MGQRQVHRGGVVNAKTLPEVVLELESRLRSLENRVRELEMERAAMARKPGRMTVSIPDHQWNGS